MRNTRLKGELGNSSRVCNELGLHRYLARSTKPTQNRNVRPIAARNAPTIKRPSGEGANIKPIPKITRN